jgi:hypothetical protein
MTNDVHEPVEDYILLEGLRWMKKRLMKFWAEN